jgi:hypothetical protein
MRASLLVRAGSLATAVVIAGGGAMVTAGAANAAVAHPKRLPTHLWIAKVPTVVHHKHVAVIAGDLRSHNVPLRGKIVFLDRKTAGHKWTVVRKEVTRRHGGVDFVVSPKVDARYVLVFQGSANFTRSHSRVVAVKAKA